MSSDWPIKSCHRGNKTSCLPGNKYMYQIPPLQKSQDFLFGILKNLLHECSGNKKIYSLRKIKFLLGVALVKYYFSWGNKSSYFTYHHLYNAGKCTCILF